MARGDELNGGLFQGLQNGEVFFPRHPEDVFDAFIFEAVYQQLGGIHSL